jgi:hypothetical protein
LRREFAPRPPGVDLQNTNREDMKRTDWTPFQTFADRGSAEALAVVLDSEGVPARVESSKLVAGVETRHCVLVPESLVHRAKWVLADTDLTDSELEYLATGKLSDTE